MSEDIIFLLTLVSALGCGLMAGVFFAFSTFVMTALARLPAAQGIAAMQSINVVAISPLFMIGLFGTAVLCILQVVFALSSWQEPSAVYELAGSVLYLVGTILVTIIFNVPRNNVLAALEPVAVDAAKIWLEYVRSWTAWNHVRSAAALAASAALTLALCQ